MTHLSLVQIDALDYLWRALQTSPDFERSRARYTQAFGALVLSQLASREPPRDARAYAPMPIRRAA